MIDPGRGCEPGTRDLMANSTYTLEIRHAAQGSGGVMHVEVGRSNAVIGPIQLPDTGGWQSWQTLTVPNVRLASGTYVMRLVFDSGNAEGWLSRLRR